MSTERLLTVERAYAAAYFFLEQHYERGPSDAVGTLLGAMSLLDDGRPADAAHWEDWSDAVPHALKPGALEKIRLVLTRP